jgi:hypothetical protein
MFLGNILDSEKNILSALGLNSGHSIMWAMPPALFALVIFVTGSCFLSQGGLDCNTSVYISHIADMAGMHHHTQILVEMVSHRLFAQTGLEL